MTDHAIRLIVSALRYVRLVLACAAQQNTKADTESDPAGQDSAALAEVAKSHAADTDDAKRKAEIEDRVWSADSAGFALILIVVLISICSIVALSVDAGLTGTSV